MERESEVIKEKIHTEPLLNSPVYITLLSVFVLVLTLIFWWIFSKGRHFRKCILLTGLSDSGKTLLFVRLVHNQYRQTFTSMKDNIADYLVGNKMLKIVDLPGQERLRGKFFDDYKDKAKALVYVVDSVTIQKEVRDVAEYLYTVLSDATVQSNSLPVLILCNKQDQALAKGSQVIKNVLEKELNLVRLTKSSQLQSVDPSSANQPAFLGAAGKDFSFTQVSARVSFAECACAGANDDHVDVTAVHKWLATL